MKSAYANTSIRVPAIFRRLVALHGVDVIALAGELQGQVRTRTWPGADGGRRDLATLPDAFPRLKADVVDGSLRILAMRLTEQSIFSNGATYARLRIRPPDLPDSVVAAFAGRRLHEVVWHEAVDLQTTVTAVAEINDKNGDPWLSMDLAMENVALDSQTDVQPAAQRPHPAPDVSALLTDVFREHGGSLPGKAASKHADWQTVFGCGSDVIGVAAGRTSDGTPCHDVRFAYDSKLVGAIGSGGFGAWFDRSVSLWRVGTDASSVAGLAGFLRDHALIVIDDEGRLHINTTRE